MGKKKENKDKDIFNFNDEKPNDENSNDEINEFLVEEKKKPSKKPFSFYINVKYNDLLEKRIDQMKRKAKRNNLEIDINKSKLLEKILESYFGE